MCHRALQNFLHTTSIHKTFRIVMSTLISRIRRAKPLTTCATFVIYWVISFNFILYSFLLSETLAQSNITLVKRKSQTKLRKIFIFIMSSWREFCGMCIYIMVQVDVFECSWKSLATPNHCSNMHICLYMYIGFSVSAIQYLVPLYSSLLYSAHSRLSLSILSFGLVWFIWCCCY